MPDNWVFLVGFLLLTLAVIIDFTVLRFQIKAFKVKSKYQSLKRLLLTCVVFLIVAASPLMFVYANVLWFHLNYIWIIYAAVLANAAAKVVIGVMLYLIYKFEE